MAGKRRPLWASAISLLIVGVVLVPKKWPAGEVEVERAAAVQTNDGLVNGKKVEKQRGIASDGLTVYFEVHMEAAPGITYPPGDYHSNGWPPQPSLPPIWR